MKVPTGKLKPNPSNPRILRDEKFLKLKASIESFPDMLNKRPIVAVTDTDGKYMVIGGNMRLRACQDLKLKEVPIILADEWTEEQRREFIIKDNVGFGEWDWDQLANEWDAGLLSDWGLDVPIAQDFSDKNQEIDTDSFADESIIKLTYSLEDYEKVREALSKVAATPEQAVWKLLDL
jgi:ParB-like chromosome segregation protein Spo0J